MAGIKETTELLVFAKALVTTYAEATRDGRVGNLADAKLLPRLVGPLRDAVKDLKGVKDELADLDRAELEALTGQTLDVLFSAVDVLGAA